MKLPVQCCPGWGCGQTGSWAKWSGSPSENTFLRLESHEISNTYIHTRLCTHTNVYIHTPTSTYIQTCMHTHTMHAHTLHVYTIRTPTPTRLPSASQLASLHRPGTWSNLWTWYRCFPRMLGRKQTGKLLCSLANRPGTLQSPHWATPGSPVPLRSPPSPLLSRATLLPAAPSLPSPSSGSQAHLRAQEGEKRRQGAAVVISFHLGRLTNCFTGCNFSPEHVFVCIWFVLFCSRG